MIIPPKRRLSVYFATLLGSAALVAALCFGLNMLVDPLWYFRGNVLTGVNYAFNERTAKMVRFLPNMAAYDCLLIGSSHTALMHEHEITGHRCFNLGFSHGRVQEYLPFARYIRARGFQPSLIFVDVDIYDFLDPPTALTVPDFIRQGKAPPSVAAAYLSLDALDFSARTLRGAFPNHLIYDTTPQMHIIPKAREYRPPRHVRAHPKPVPFHAELAASFPELRALFPEAHAIGWAAPLSGWFVARLKLDGDLDAYLEALHRISGSFDEFYDFSIPSDITASTHNTYDGIHYIDAVNSRILAAILSGNPSPGVDWRRLSHAEIAAQYEERLDTLIFHPPLVSQADAVETASTAGSPRR